METLYLLCNAHLDPVWLWQRKEGRAEAISTFRVAAEFCEEFDGFVFNHNESLLYEWVEQEEPPLFKKIQKLVRQGKWNIIGGTYLQPDCNLPSGESLLRQIKTGQDYFQEKFGVRTRTAFHVDPFGHSRGLVQILKKMGYENYIFMRPHDGPRDFIWEGLDGSKLCAHRLWDSYNSLKGEATVKIERYLKENQSQKTGLLLWGVGNHGGGPSREDLEQICKIREKYPEISIVHSDAAEYFDNLDLSALPVVAESLRPSMVGCYTSMCRVKQKHRQAENSLAVCQKMMAHAEMEDVDGEIEKAKKALLFNEFHDILPGSAIRPAEEEALCELDYAIAIFERYMERAFLKLCSGQKKAKDGEIPILVYNPHPYPVETDVAVEFQLQNQNWARDEFTIGKVYQADGVFLPTQNEKEASNMNLDWRKNLVFHAKLAPMSMNRFDCVLKAEKNYQKVQPYEETPQEIIMRSQTEEVRISKKSGLIASYLVDGKQAVEPQSGKLCVYFDNEDAWGSGVDSYLKLKGEFCLLDDKDALQFAGCEPIKVIENGEVRMKVQAFFSYSYSFAVVTYTLSKFGKGLNVDITLFSNDKNVMVKYCVKTAFDQADFYGQTVFGTEQLHKGHKEECYQKWCGLKRENAGFYVLNQGIHGGSSDGKELRLSLLHTPAYSAQPIEEGRPLVEPNRYLERIDVGERRFAIKLLPYAEAADIDFQAQVYNEGTEALSFFPSGEGTLPGKLPQIDNPVIIMTSLTRTKTGSGYEFRLYNGSDQTQNVCIILNGENHHAVSMQKFEVKRFTTEGTDLKEESTIA